MDNIKSILFISLDRIGDTIRASFFPRILRKHFPDAFIAFLCAEPSDELLRTNPHIDAVYTMPHAEIRKNLTEQESSILKTSFPIFNLLNTIKQKEFDVVINPFSDFGAISMPYIKPKYVLGRVMKKDFSFIQQGENSAKFYYLMRNQNDLRKEASTSFSELYAKIIKDLNIHLLKKDLAPEIHLSLKTKSFAEDFLAQKIKKGTHLIGLQPGAFVAGKCWPLDKFLSLSQSIIKKTTASILINGSKFEKESFGEKFTKINARRIILPPAETSILESAALIEKCSFFISNDTGPLHIAAAFNIPTTAFFGYKNTIPEQSKPWGEDTKVFAEKNISDIPFKAVEEYVIKKILDLPSIS